MFFTIHISYYSTKNLINEQSLHQKHIRIVHSHISGSLCLWSILIPPFYAWVFHPRGLFSSFHTKSLCSFPFSPIYTIFSAHLAFIWSPKWYLVRSTSMLGQVTDTGSRENHGCDGLTASRKQPAYDWKT